MKQLSSFAVVFFLILIYQEAAIGFYNQSINLRHYRWTNRSKVNWYLHDGIDSENGVWNQTTNNNRTQIKNTCWSNWCAEYVNEFADLIGKLLR